jgi:DNA topoisomerase IA
MYSICMQAHVKKHLQECAKGCQHIVLWLDCDREGENICFEVLECCTPHMRPAVGRHVWRARFSAISAAELHAAMAKLVEPNQAEALSVDARQELDLKVRLAAAPRRCNCKCATVPCLLHEGAGLLWSRRMQQCRQSGHYIRPC